MDKKSHSVAGASSVSEGQVRRNSSNVSRSRFRSLLWDNSSRANLGRSDLSMRCPRKIKSSLWRSFWSSTWPRNSERLSTSISGSVPISNPLPPHVSQSRTILLFGRYKSLVPASTHTPWRELRDFLNELDGGPFNRAVLGWKTELAIS